MAASPKHHRPGVTSESASASAQGGLTFQKADTGSRKSAEPRPAPAMEAEMTKRSDIELELIGAAILNPTVAATDQWHAYEWECETCAWVSRYITSRVAQDPSISSEAIAIGIPDAPAVTDAGGRKAFVDGFVSLATDPESVGPYLTELHNRWTIERIEYAVNRALKNADPGDPDRLLHVLEQITESEGAGRQSSSDQWPLLAFSEPYRNDAQSSYLVKGLLSRGDLAMVYGPSGSGKSFFVSDLSLSIARGTPWREHRVNPAGVAYVVAEGAVGFDRRLEAYSKAYDVETCPNFQRLIASPNLLASTPETGKLIQHLSKAEARMCDPLGLIVIDTLARVIPGQNENAFETMGAVADEAARLQRRFNATVLFVHHSGKDAERGPRGHSSLYGASDTIIEIMKPNEAGETAAHVCKQKDGEIGAAYGFKLKSVDLGVDSDGDPRSSCVVEFCDPPTASDYNSSGHSQRALTALKTACTTSSHTFADTGAPMATEDEWRTAFRCLPDIEGMKPDSANTAFRRAKGALLDSGKVIEARGIFAPAEYIRRDDAA